VRRSQPVCTLTYPGGTAKNLVTSGGVGAVLGAWLRGGLVAKRCARTVRGCAPPAFAQVAALKSFSFVGFGGWPARCDEGFRRVESATHTPKRSLP